jgi:hypothetical protein
VAWGLVQTPMMRGLEDWLLDGCFALRGRRATSAPILVVDLGKLSLSPGRRIRV